MFPVRLDVPLVDLLHVFPLGPWTSAILEGLYQPPDSTSKRWTPIILLWALVPPLWGADPDASDRILIQSQARAHYRDYRAISPLAGASVGFFQCRSKGTSWLSTTDDKLSLSFAKKVEEDFVSVHLRTNSGESIRPRRRESTIFKGRIVYNPETKTYDVFGQFYIDLKKPNIDPMVAQILGAMLRSWDGIPATLTAATGRPYHNLPYDEQHGEYSLVWNSGRPYFFQIKASGRYTRRISEGIPRPPSVSKREWGHIGKHRGDSILDFETELRIPPIQMVFTCSGHARKNTFMTLPDGCFHDLEEWSRPRAKGEKSFAQSHGYH